MRKVLGAELPEGSPANTTLLLRRPSETVRQRLDNRATTTENLLPIVFAHVMLSGLVSIVTDPCVSLTDAELPSDTGAHSTVVIDELFPEKSKDYLKQPGNDCYRSTNGIRVHVQREALATFTNQALALSCVCKVVPRSAVPNGWVGIILGQNMGINRLVYKTVLRAILPARGECVPETVRGGFS